MSLWGISKNRKGELASIIVSGEASVAGGHWSTVTSCCVSADSLLTCDAQGLCLLWFLCRIPRSRRPAVSSRPYFVLRGHSSPVTLSAMSHSVGIAVTSSQSRPRELLVHCLPRPPPNGPDYEPGDDAPLRSIDVSCQEPFSVNGVGVPAYDASKYVVTLAVICMSGDIVVHAHHVDFRDYEDFGAASASAPPVTPPSFCEATASVSARSLCRSIGCTPSFRHHS